MGEDAAMMVLIWLKRYEKMVSKYGDLPADVLLRKMFAVDWLMAWVVENYPDDLAEASDDDGDDDDEDEEGDGLVIEI